MDNTRSIGELIENEVRKQEIPITEFAKMIHCERNNVYNIFSRDNMDIIQLKRISNVLKRNFFKELAEDIELINDTEESEEEKQKRESVSQFFAVVPNVLQQLGKSSTIIFSRIDDPEYKDCPTPDFGLPDYFITFTIGDTLKDRFGHNRLLTIETIKNNDGTEIEICTNTFHHSRCINIKLDYKSQDEWYKTLKFAFENL